MPNDENYTSRIDSILDTASSGEIPDYDELITLASQRLLMLTKRMLRPYPQLSEWEQTDDVFQSAAMQLYRSLTDKQADSVRGFFELATALVRQTLLDLTQLYASVSGVPSVFETLPLESLQHATGKSVETLELWEIFHMIVGSLPDAERETFSLIWYGGLTHKQTSFVVGVSERTVIRRLYSARLQLAHILEDYEKDVIQHDASERENR